MKKFKCINSACSLVSVKFENNDQLKDTIPYCPCCNYHLDIKEKKKKKKSANDFQRLERELESLSDNIELVETGLTRLLESSSDEIKRVEMKMEKIEPSNTNTDARINNAFTKLLEISHKLDETECRVSQLERGNVSMFDNLNILTEKVVRLFSEFREFKK